MPERIDSIYDFSDKALGELKAWLEPWFQARATQSIGPIDSTENVGLPWGVQSNDLVTGPEVATLVLTSIGDGGSIWSASSTSSGFRDVITGSQYAACLLAYWRLGDPASPFVDSNPYLSPIDLTRVANTTALTTGVTGALLGSQDDGAVQFNGWGNTGSVPPGTAGDYLTATTTRFNFGGATNYSVAAWVKPLTHSLVGYDFQPSIVAGMANGALNEYGWSLDYDWPSNLVIWRRRADGSSDVGTSATIPLDNYTFVVGTHAATGGVFKLYVNGTLANSHTGSTTTSNAGLIEVGRGTHGGYNYYNGMVDELAVFQCVLTPEQVLELYNASNLLIPSAGLKVFQNGA